jgi:hypothetical protein
MDLLDHFIGQFLAERVTQNRFGLDFCKLRQEVGSRKYLRKGVSLQP